MPAIRDRVFPCFYLVVIAVFSGELASGQLPGTGTPQAEGSGLLRIARSEDRDKLLLDSALEFEAFSRQSAVLRKVVRLVRPAVVHIEARKSEIVGDAGSPRLFDEAGAGVFIEYQGRPYILTNRHVVQDASLADIKLKLADGRQINPTGLLSDKATDVAVLLVDIDAIMTARLGDSEQIEIGDYVLAMGSPFGLSHSVTHGIVSAKGRRDLELGTDHVRIQNFLQTDAAINPGNSGGPLVNMRGQVVGVNTAIASNSGGNEGIAFSIPINLAWQVMQELIENGHVERGYLGVQLDNDFQLAEAKELGLPWLIGTRVSGVTPGGPADEYGLEAGDVIVRFNSVTVEDVSHLVSLVGTTPVGTEATLDLFRDGSTHQISIPVLPRVAAQTRPEIESLDGLDALDEYQEFEFP